MGAMISRWYRGSLEEDSATVRFSPLMDLPMVRGQSSLVARVRKNCTVATAS